MSCTLPSHALSKELVLHANNVNTLKQLLLNGADVNYQSSTGWCLLFEFISLGLDEEIELLCVEYSMNIRMKDAKGRNALFWAIYHKNDTIVQRLISLGCDPKENILPGLPSLHYTVYTNNIDIINILLKHGIDINSEDTHGIRALNYAYIYELEDMIRYLEKLGATCCDLKPLL